MPNIEYLIKLNEKYNYHLKINNIVKISNRLRNESELSKEAGFDVNNLVEHFDITKFTNRGKFRIHLENYFKLNETANVVLLFIDITNFSNIINNKSNYFIKKYLDNFYLSAFPIIYKNGGQIEKLMGDGIICVFGEPFINTNINYEFNLAEMCAAELIKKFIGTNKEIKIALHYGEINYYKTPLNYNEYTMIGKTISELYRLESVSMNNSINFFSGSTYDNYFNPFLYNYYSEIDPSEVIIKSFMKKLKGVNYSKIKYLKFK